MLNLVVRTVTTVL